ncbi:unnamed protein product, partial [Coregonus sp. 'balchen']
ENACDRCMLKACICCLWIPKSKINSTSFCMSARDPFVILELIVSCTAFAGILALNYQQDYTVWVLPLLIICLFSWLVAHCFLSVFEIVVDMLFVCFAVDTKHNDRSPSQKFYMD